MWRENQWQPRRIQAARHDRSNGDTLTQSLISL